MAAPNLVLPSYWPEKQPGVKLAIRHADRLSVSLPSLQQQQAPQQPFRPSSVNGAGHDGVDYGEREWGYVLLPVCCPASLA